MWKLSLVLLTLVGCQGAREDVSVDAVVRARVELTPRSDGTFEVSNAVRPLGTQFDLDFGQAVIPPITNTMLYFGKLAIAQLNDDNLRSCNGKQCTRAFIRMYTTGTPGAGAWNAAGGYGMPIFANRTGESMKTVGLNATGAAVVQTYAIPTTKKSLSLADFPSANYEMRADFTQAGAGTYSTTLVVEYGLE